MNIERQKRYHRYVKRRKAFRFLVIIGGIAVLTFLLDALLFRYPNASEPVTKKASLPLWVAPDIATIPNTPEGELIRYGQRIISNTADYLGPHGLTAKVSNSTSCENCHLAAGTKPFANNFSAVASIYPVYRDRSGLEESVEYRINDCLKRSMNGQPIDSASREMQAMAAYIKWLGKDVPKGKRPNGFGTYDLRFLNRPADTLKGRIVYNNKCKLCHGHHGEGTLRTSGEGFLYPPLWGPESYNTGAGMLRLSKFAGFIKSNMPFGTTYEKPQLTDEEAWDVAAFVNSMPRPEKKFPKDWPDLEWKAFDSPFGPYVDNFSEHDHKYGPFGPIRAAQDSILKRKKNAGQ